MNNDINIDVKKLKPITRFIYTIGELPTSYLMSMSYEEQLIWLCNYLEKTVIPAINNNASATEQLQQNFIELKSYVDDYFENLDVQDEIDNKIDDLVESGTLAEIITSYLTIAGVLAFDTKAALKAGTNFIDGSVARTLGTTTYNDGYGYYYKIRTLINTDVVDDDKLVALTNYPTLVAEKIEDSAINELNTKIKQCKLLKNKKTIIIGDSLCLTGGWGDKFVFFSGCDGEVYGNGSAGFTSEGITPPYANETFGEMLDDIISSKTTAQKNEVEYLIVGGGINDALNNHTPSSIKTAVGNFITAAKTGFPNAKIIIFPLHTFKWLTNIELQRYQTIIDSCRNDGIMTTSDFLFWTTDDRTYDSGDHTHLSDGGYQVISNKILSWINGSNNVSIENVEYTLAQDWELGTWFNIYKRDNIVYIQGILHYTGGTLALGDDILTFEKGAYITGGASYNKLIPTLYYSGGNDTMSNVNVTNGSLKTGRSENYTELSNPYLYINGLFVEGIQGDIAS